MTMMMTTTTTTTTFFRYAVIIHESYFNLVKFTHTIVGKKMFDIENIPREKFYDYSPPPRATKME